jgi:hypothetical protein
VDSTEVQPMTPLSEPIVKTLTITPSQWKRLLAQLQQDYGPTIVLLRDRRRRELGFVDRQYWHRNSKGHSTLDICLDFYDNGLKAWFLIKYSEYVRQRSP